MFPYFSTEVIIEDLINTRSIELTIDNILEERLVGIHGYFEDEPLIVETPQMVVEQFINNTPSSR